jgi:hypothetical protein
MHWSDVPDGVTPKVTRRDDLRSAGVKRTGEGRVVVIHGIAELDGSDILVPVPERNIHGGLLALNEDQAKSLLTDLQVLVQSWSPKKSPSEYLIGYEQALLDAARNIENPEKRAEVAAGGLGLGWEAGQRVVDKMIQDLREGGSNEGPTVVPGAK